MADVLNLPIQKKRDRRRSAPVPGAPIADVLDMARRSALALETTEQMLERYREADRLVTYHLLQAARALRGLDFD